MVHIKCFTSKEKNHAVALMYLFMKICLPQFLFPSRFLNCFFFGKALAIVTKRAVLDVAGILNPIQYAQT